MPRARSKAELEDDLKERDRRIADLKAELEETRDLAQRQDEQLQDVEAVFEGWKEAFEMTVGDDGLWSFPQFIATANQYHDKYVALLKNWNKFVPEYNAAVSVNKRNVGRPLAASEAQVATVRKLRAEGQSLRAIAEATNLGLKTVCTIIDKGDGVDRTTIKHLKRIDPDRAAERLWQARRRTRDSLPKRIAATEKANAELRLEAKGLKSVKD